MMNRKAMPNAPAGNQKPNKQRMIEGEELWIDISLAEFKLNLKYMMHLKPENETLKKLVLFYDNHKKQKLSVDVLKKASDSVGFTPEEFKIIRSIKTEEDLQKYCSN